MPVKAWLEANGIVMAIALVAGIVGAGATAVVARPAATTIEVHPLVPQPTVVIPIYVHVDGAVEAPGVYRLPDGARTFDAIDAAGGASDDADLGGLNLAARVTDGQKLVVPIHGGGTSSSPGVAGSPTPAQSGKVNLNTASQRLLETLPGIGTVTATRIFAYRQANGPFTRIEQLLETRLVNASTYDKIKGQITV